MTGFSFEPADAIAHLRAADPALLQVMNTAGPFAMELKKVRSVFGALAEVIVYQQLSNKAAATIFGRLCSHFPRGSAGLTAERSDQPLAVRKLVKVVEVVALTNEDRVIAGGGRS